MAAAVSAICPLRFRSDCEDFSGSLTLAGGVVATAGLGSLTAAARAYCSALPQAPLTHQCW
jgi:hypothetical protein